MTRTIASITTASLLALAACGSPKTEDAPAADTTMTDPITTEVPPAIDTAPVDETMTMPAEPMPTETGEGEGDEDTSPGNAGNDKGRATGDKGGG